jgi:hypothetical protein
VTGSVTVITIRRDRISEVEALPAVNAAVDRTVANGVARVLFIVNPAPGGSMLFKVSQGGLMIEETITTDTQFVFDVS